MQNNKFKTFVYIPTTEYAIIDVNEPDKKVILYTSNIPHLLPLTCDRDSYIEYTNRVFKDYEFDFNFEDLELIEVELTLNKNE